MTPAQIAHKDVIEIAVLLVIVIVLIAIAGVSKEWAVAVGLFAFLAFFLAIHTDFTPFTNFVANYTTP